MFLRCVDSSRLCRSAQKHAVLLLNPFCSWTEGRAWVADTGEPLDAPASARSDDSVILTQAAVDAMQNNSKSFVSRRPSVVQFADVEHSQLFPKRDRSHSGSTVDAQGSRRGSVRVIRAPLRACCPTTLEFYSALHSTPLHCTILRHELMAAILLRHLKEPQSSIYPLR